MTKSPASSRGADLVGRVEVALRVRRVLEELAVVVPVALRRLDLRRRLEVQHPLLRARVRLEPPGRPDRQDEVVAGSVAQRPEDRVADAGALVDEEHLVGDAVAVEPALGHRLGRPDDAEDHVVVEVQRDPAADRVAARLDAAGLRQAVAMEVVVGRLELDAPDRLDLVGPRRRDEVVEERRPAGEALDPEQLLGVERAVRRAVLGVALLRDAAALDVVHGATGLLGVEEASLVPCQGSIWIESTIAWSSARSETVVPAKSAVSTTTRMPSTSRIQRCRWWLGP